MKCWCIAAAPLFFNLGRPLSPTMAPRIAIAFLALLAFLSCSETYAQTDYMFLNLGVYIYIYSFFSSSFFPLFELIK